MHSQLKSLMAATSNSNSNSKLFLSDKDLNAADDPAVDSKLVSKLAVDGKNKNRNTNTKKKKMTTTTTTMMKKKKTDMDVPSMKVPSLGLEKRFKVNDENRKEEEGDGDGARTPTSSDYKIPAIRRCPLAPRKPKSLKRTLPVQHGIAVGFDLANDYLESMFPPTPPSKKKLFAPAAPAVPSNLNVGGGRINKCLSLSP